jgi:hypothetical protein
MLKREVSIVRIGIVKDCNVGNVFGRGGVLTALSDVLMLD